MTLNELEKILNQLNKVPGCAIEPCSVCDAREEAIAIVEREIKLKKLDPRK